MNNKILLGLVVVVILAALAIRLTAKDTTTSATMKTDSGIQLSDVEITQQAEEGGAPTMDKPKMEIDENATYVAVFKTSMGDITVNLFAQETPVTVNNFVVLAQKGFYDGTIFHRVIEDFMIQGGDPVGNGTGGPGYTFEDEFSPRTFDGPGILAMANSGPDTNGSQFFITQAATTWLNGKHTIFGEVTDGMAVVDAIAQVEKGPQDRPVKDVVIKTIEIAKR